MNIVLTIFIYLLMIYTDTYFFENLLRVGIKMNYPKNK